MNASDSVVLPRAEYEALLERLEDLEDARGIEAFLAGPPRPTLSAERVDRLLSGVPPLRLWREEAGLTVAALAEKSGVAPAYLSEIESGKKPGSAKALLALARALGLAVEDLIAED